MVEGRLAGDRQDYRFRLGIKPRRSASSRLARSQVVEQVELYNLAQDVREERDLAKQHAEMVSRLLPEVSDSLVPAGITGADGRPDLGALEHGETVDDRRRRFEHVGPHWLTPANATGGAPHRPQWPESLDRRWGGIDTEHYKSLAE